MRSRKSNSNSSAPPFSQQQDNSQIKTTGRRYVSTSTDLSHVLMMIVLVFCRKVTTGLDIRRRFTFYFSLIVFGGLVGDFAPILVSALMPIKLGKMHFLNQWFVKLGWLWTLSLVSPFVYMTAEILQKVKRREKEDQEKQNSDLTSCPSSSSPVYSVEASISATQVEGSSSFFYKIVTIIKERKDLIRLVGCTLVWYLSVMLFEWVDVNTTSCSINTNRSRSACLRAGGRWYPGFDISGHTFLLLFSNLIIFEECRSMIDWDPLGDLLSAKQFQCEKKSIASNEECLLYRSYSVWIRILFILLTILSILWDFMLIQTALFYHSMIQKFLAFVWASSAWYILYRIVYKFFNIPVMQVQF